MGYPQGIPRARIADSSIVGGAGDDTSSSGSGNDEAYLSPTRRRHRPWLRTLVVVFVAVEIVISAVLHNFTPVFNFDITQVTSTNGTTVIGSNADLEFPIKLGGGTSCHARDLVICVQDDVTSSTLFGTCCVELLSEDSDGPEELISTIMLFGYIGVIPALILIVRGFLLGRIWTRWPFRPSRENFHVNPNTRGGWGKKRWHLRVGFYSLDTCIGLPAAIITAYMFAYVAKVTTGRPRPNYYALQAFTEYGANGEVRLRW